MIFLQLSMSASEFQELVDIDIRNILIPWKMNTAEQQGYYLVFAQVQERCRYGSHIDAIEFSVEGGSAQTEAETMNKDDEITLH